MALPPPSRVFSRVCNDLDLSYWHMSICKGHGQYAAVHSTMEDYNFDVDAFSVSQERLMRMLITRNVFPNELSYRFILPNYPRQDKN